MAAEVLRAENVWKSYGGVRALSGAELSINAGEVHAVMGENGAGKSTLGKILAGAVEPDDGQIFVGGQLAEINGPLDAQRLGICIIHQELDLFPNLSVAENIVIGNEEFAENGIVRFKGINRFAEEFLRQVGVRVSAKRRVASMSIGEMQLVVIARALSMRARIIIMDEPTSSLFHDSVERLFALIEKLRAQGASIVYVSHKMDEIQRICDRVTVMRDGKTVGTRLSKETSAAELIGMMVGRAWRPGERKQRSVKTEALLTVAALSTRKLKNVSFELRRGEVLGVAGLVGAGRSELGMALVGLDHWKQGTMMLRGEPVNAHSVENAQELGIRLLAEDRKLDGLMMQMSVLENGTMADLRKLASNGFTKRSLEERAVAPIFGRLAVKTSSLTAPVSSLSGGGQQKVLLARCLLGNPDVVFLDDPTRGIDVGAKEDIYAMIEQLAEQEKGVIFVSSELPELLRCCDRIMVMREGKIVADLQGATATQEEIMTYATSPVAEARGDGWLN